MKGIAEGTYNSKHAEAARLYYTTTLLLRLYTYTHTHTYWALSSNTLMNVVTVPIIESNTELQGTRHSSMTARNVGGTTDRNSLSTRQANGAAVLVEVDAAAVAVLLLVRLIAEGRAKPVL